ncbi:MAG: hypothetical protein RLZZ628_346 [Bacteroidota bacterium]|jgi:hypothetical protein
MESHLIYIASNDYFPQISGIGSQILQILKKSMYQPFGRFEIFQTVDNQLFMIQSPKSAGNGPLTIQNHSVTSPAPPNSACSLTKPNVARRFFNGS